MLAFNCAHDKHLLTSRPFRDMMLMLVVANVCGQMCHAPLSSTGRDAAMTSRPVFGGIVQALYY